MSLNNDVKFLEDRFFDKCKEVYKKAQHAAVMDDWDGGFNVGNVFAVEEILTAAMSREAIEEQFKQWDEELKNETIQIDKSG